MKIIKTYYLIDYENVEVKASKDAKITGNRYYPSFYTDNSRKIDLDIINDHGESKLITHKVPTGISQQICIWILSGISDRKECTGQDEECKIVVISKDTGFDHIIEFWKAEKNENFQKREDFRKTDTDKETGKKTDQ